MLETQRLMIRQGNEKDVEDIYLFRNTEFVLKYNCMEIADKASILKEISNSLVLYEKNINQAIGVISIENDTLRYGVKSKCLSYYLNENYARQGYMYEALTLVVKELFELGCDILSARVFVGNDASKKLLEKLGFVCEGKLTYAVKGYQGIIYDDQLFSLIKEKQG